MFKVKGFSIVELVVVIAVLIILSGIGVAGTSFILDYSRKQVLRSAVDQLSTATVTYWSSKGKYPSTSGTGRVNTISILVNSSNLGPFLEKFDPNAEADFYYLIDNATSPTVYAYCVKLEEKSLYCAGNGVGSNKILGGVATIPNNGVLTNNISDCNAGSGCLTAKWNTTSKSF